MKEGGRGATIWDAFSHMNPPKVARNENGDVACDSYHRRDRPWATAATISQGGRKKSFDWVESLVVSLFLLVYI